MNYTGLRLGDVDFEGYISVGDINKNNLIDAYDISNVTTLLRTDDEDEDESFATDAEKVSGSIELVTPKRSYNADEIIEISVKGNQLKSVNALSFALAYDQTKYEYIGTENKNCKQMENLTYDRLHTNGNKSLYPTWINIGSNKEMLEGSEELFIIKFKAKQRITFDLKPTEGILVDKELNSIKF